MGSPSGWMELYCDVPPCAVSTRLICVSLWCLMHRGMRPEVGADQQPLNTAGYWSVPSQSPGARICALGQGLSHCWLPCMNA